MAVSAFSRADRRAERAAARAERSERRLLEGAERFELFDERDDLEERERERERERAGAARDERRDVDPPCLDEARELLAERCERLPLLLALTLRGGGLQIVIFDTS